MTIPELAAPKLKPKISLTAFELENENDQNEVT